MATTQELDLYATRGWRESFDLRVLGWKGIVGFALALLLLGGVATYGWMTKSAPVSVDRALAEFRQGSSQGTDESAAVSNRRPSGSDGRRDKSSEQEPKRKGDERGADRSSKVAVAVAAPSSDQPARQDGQREQAAAPAQQQNSDYARSAPREGVYTWDTQGWESAGGARRELPEETQRIVNVEEGGWQTHHYFSEQRENWTRFEVLDSGAAIAMQRNKVTFGPVTNDSTIDFAPPMLVAPRNLEVGRKWSGTWSGKTSGAYQGEIFERVEIVVGGETVEAWGIHVHSEMRGEIEGEVDARVWLSPKYALTVKEHYTQNVKADVGSYRSEWSMTLQSLDPQT